MEHPEPLERPVLEVFLFGGVRLRAGGKELSDRSSRSMKLWNVLSYLILNRERSATQSELVEAFWPDESQSDPIGALKMLILRIRSTLKPLLGDVDPIIGRRGEYQWSPDVICQVDVDRFQSICAQVEKISEPGPEQEELLREATDLYKAGLLPRFRTQPWLLPLSERCHSLYVKAVIAYADLLERRRDYDRMEALCLQASSVGHLDERLHGLVIRALFLQEKYSEAIQYYRNVSDILFNELGVRPSEKLQALHKQILSAEDLPPGDLAELMPAMDEGEVTGAFCCEPGLFRSIYQLELRRMPRNGSCLHVALLTLSTPEGTPPNQAVIEPLMAGLLEDVMSSLRNGDVVARNGPNQYIIMLPGANLEDGTAVMERLCAKARRRLRSSLLKLTYQLRGLGEA